MAGQTRKFFSQYLFVLNSDIFKMKTTFFEVYTVYTIHQQSIHINIRLGDFGPCL